MKKTCKKISFKILDSYFLAWNNTLNIDYLKESIITQVDVTWRHDKIKRAAAIDLYKKNKIKNIIWAAFLDMSNDYLKYNDYENFTCTSDHLKKYLAFYGCDYSIFDNTFYDDIKHICSSFIND